MFPLYEYVFVILLCFRYIIMFPIYHLRYVILLCFNYIIIFPLYDYVSIILSCFLHIIKCHLYCFFVSAMRTFEDLINDTGGMGRFQVCVCVCVCVCVFVSNCTWLKIEHICSCYIVVYWSLSGYQHTWSQLWVGKCMLVNNAPVGLYSGTLRCNG